MVVIAGPTDKSGAETRPETGMGTGTDAVPAVKPLQLLRGFTVASGGPALLATGAGIARVSAIRRWPNRLPPGPARGVAWGATVAGIVLPWVYALAVRPRLQRWGSTADERLQRFPGDPDAKPLSTTTRAVTIEAPAREVWQWLVQIGQDRGGFYSYDWLENLAGCHLQSADRVREDLQHLAPDDPLMMMPGVGTRIAEVRPGRSILIENWGAYVIAPLTRESCRLIARSHVERGPGAIPYILFIELPHAVMERKMLLGIKERAEKLRSHDQTHTGGHDADEPLVT